MSQGSENAFSSLKKVVDRRSSKDSLNTYRFDFAPFLTKKLKKIGHFFTLGGESVDLDKLSTSLFVYLVLIVSMCPSLCCLRIASSETSL